MTATHESERLAAIGIINLFDRVKRGGDMGARTPNLRIANAALSQLSYIPTLSITIEARLVHGQGDLDTVAQATA